MPKNNSCLNCIFLEEENVQLKKKLREIELEGWKGKDSIVFEKIEENWHVTEHRKQKHSGNIVTSPHIIPEKDVNNLWSLITTSTEKKTSYRELVPLIISDRNLNVQLEEFNGGRNRSKYYFPLYYYPCKILEKVGLISYGGRGTITILEEK